MRGTAVALVAGALVLAGCGSKHESKSAKQAWADGFCGALVNWRDSVRSAGSSLKDIRSLNETKIENAATELKAANTALADSVRKLGPPPQSQAAKSAVQTLSTKLARSANEIKGAVANVTTGSDLVNAVSVTTSALATMASDVTATVDELRSMKGADEWNKAFADSDACQSLKQS